MPIRKKRRKENIIGREDGRIDSLPGKYPVGHITLEYAGIAKQHARTARQQPDVRNLFAQREGREEFVLMPLPSLEQMEADEQKKWQKLRAASKPLYELVIAERFKVTGAVCSSYAMSHTPIAEMIIGGSSPVYNGGYRSSLELMVTPLRNIGIERLRFEGSSAVRVGDIIEAIIPLYEKKSVPSLRTNHLGTADPIYFPRTGFRKDEVAIQLALLSSDLKLLRTDRSVDYHKYVKPEEKHPQSKEH